MSEPLLTKRLHISGLTPSITPADLEHRLSSFGKIKAMDGFGARDALGDPRKFGFVTMEIGAKELAKCLNVLSGSTWKGTKLRIGEAKPDFLERLAQVNSQPLKPIRPKRTHAQNCGNPSCTLPLIPLSASTAASTPGWIVTPSGRVVRPMRMRPERPLEPMHSELGASKAKGVNGKVKKRVKPPPVRARRRLIDPTKWDSVYLKGIFLDNISVPFPASEGVLEPSGLAKLDATDERELGTEEDSIDGDSFAGIVQKAAEPPHNVSQFAQNRACSQYLEEDALGTPSMMHEAAESINVRDETSAALVMLDKMFGDKRDWDGRESVDEAEGLEDGQAREKEMHDVEVDDIEIVPRDLGDGKGGKFTKNTERRDEKSLRQVRVHRMDGMNLGAAHDVEMDGSPADVEVSARTTEHAPGVSLKALFAPREEASFSLLDHLDIDLDVELDTDVFGISAPSSAPQDNNPLFKPSSPEPLPAAVSAVQARSRVVLDPSLPLLFPLPDALPHQHTPSSNPTTKTYKHGTPSCFLFPSETRVRGLNHLPPSITFTRSSLDTPESIRERWEKDKSSLTHDWKKAWREARRNKRGKVGAAGDIGGSY